MIDAEEMLEDDALPEGEDVPMPEDDTTVEDTEDGGAIVRLENDEEAAVARAHFDNIVEDVDQSELAAIITDVVTKVEQDIAAREKRDKLYEEGLRRTGLADDAPGGANFSGATRVVHPMLIEACVDFSARVMKELMPPAGPVKSKVYGPQDVDKMDKARRKSEFMNWQLTESVTEFRGELEQLSTQLGLSGVNYLKWSWDHQRRRPTTEFVPVDDLILPYVATNFYTAQRRTHRQYITEETYRNRVKSGMYRDIELPMPEMPEQSKAEKANQKIEGKTDDSYNQDGLRTLYEVSLSLDIEEPGEYAPYILTIDKSTNTALALVRNWDPEDEFKQELDHFSEYPFIPWRGSAPIGLTHLIGGLAAASTGALRALLDSAHISNVPSGLRLKGGPNGQTLNPQVGQIAEVESSAMVDDIRKIFMPLPFNPPSAVLFSLLGFLSDAGKGVVQTSFEKLSEANQNAPVGTTLALIEQGMVVFSSIHSRLHAAQARSLKILHRLNSAYLTDEILKSYNSGCEVRPQDFDGPSDVVPVSDPQIFSDSQRFAQTQAIQQRAGQMPQLYDARKVEEMFLRAMKVNPEDVLVPEPGKDDVDPVSENVAATMGRPLYVLPGQDHLAHIQIHLAYLNSPLFGSNPAIVKTFLWPMAQHLRDHVIQAYRSAVIDALADFKREGIKLNEEQETELVLAIQKQIEQGYPQVAQILAQVDQAAQQYKPQPQMPPDNSLQVAQLNAQVTQQKLQQDGQLAQQKLQTQAQTDAQKLQLEGQKLQLDVQVAEMRKQVDAMREQQKLMLEQFRQAQENKRSSEQVHSRERMNSADNQTAITIAAAEIASGERVGVSSGTGINP